MIKRYICTLVEIERKDGGRSVPIRCSKKIEVTIEVHMMLMLPSIAGISNFHLRTSACRDRIFIYGPNLFSQRFEDSICRHINPAYVLYNCSLAINYEEINFNEEISPRIQMKVRKHLHAERNYDPLGCFFN